MTDETNNDIEFEIVSRECHNVSYTEANDGSYDDLTLVKEILTYKDGTKKNRLYSILNHQRDFYITKPQFQNHEEWKEWEERRKVQKFTTNTHQMRYKIAGLMGRRPGTRLRHLNRSPYLYGTDVGNVQIIKQKYRKHFPEAFTPYSVAVLDFETDMIHGTGEIIIGGLTMKDKVLLVCTKDYLHGIDDVHRKVNKCLQRLLGKLIADRNIKLDFRIVDREIDIVTNCIDALHEWQPDWCTFWNMNFDVNKMIDACNRAGVDPAQVFSDPSVPDRFKYFHYREDQAKKVTSSGKETNKHPAELWHVADFPASFHFIDAMCVYQCIRIANGKEPSYSLDAILKKHKLGGKLKFDAVQSMEGTPEWHTEMQRDFRIEYLIYNIYDSLGVELLDEITLDLQVSAPLHLGISELARFRSNPRRLVDDINFFIQDYNLVMGSSSDQLEIELDKHSLSLDGWITTLPAHHTIEMGQKIVSEFPNLETMITAHNYDLDILSSYPKTQYFLNMSKETTFRELCKLMNIPESTQRRVGINLTGGKVNAMNIAQDIFNFPSMDDMLEAFIQEECQ